MKVAVYIPSFGRSIYEAESVDAELAALKAKFPDVADRITVSEASFRRLSDTEIAALDAVEPADEDEE